MSFCGPHSQSAFFYNHDIHPCIQSLALNCVPALLIFLLGLNRLKKIWHRTIYVHNWTDIKPRAPIVCTALLAFISCINIARYITASPIVGHQLLQAILSAMAWIVVTCVICTERRRSVSLHYAIRLYWLFSFLVLIKSLESAFVSLSLGVSFDDTMLLDMLRLPVACALAYYALMWRQKAYDGDGDEFMQRLAEEEDELSTNEGGIRMNSKTSSSTKETTAASTTSSATPYTTLSSHPQHDEESDEVHTSWSTISSSFTPSNVWGKFLRFGAGPGAGAEKKSGQQTQQQQQPQEKEANTSSSRASVYIPAAATGSIALPIDSSSINSNNNSNSGSDISRSRRPNTSVAIPISPPPQSSEPKQEVVIEDWSLRRHDAWGRRGNVI